MYVCIVCVCVCVRYVDSASVQSCLVLAVSLLMRHRRFDEELETYRAALLVGPALTRTIKRYDGCMDVCMYVCMCFVCICMYVYRMGGCTLYMYV